MRPWDYNSSFKYWNIIADLKDIALIDLVEFQQLSNNSPVNMTLKIKCSREKLEKQMFTCSYVNSEHFLRKT